MISERLILSPFYVNSFLGCLYPAGQLIVFDESRTAVCPSIPSRTKSPVSLKTWLLRVGSRFSLLLLNVKVLINFGAAFIKYFDGLHCIIFLRFMFSIYSRICALILWYMSASATGKVKSFSGITWSTET